MLIIRNLNLISVQSSTHLRPAQRLEYCILKRAQRNARKETRAKKQASLKRRQSLLLRLTLG